MFINMNHQTLYLQITSINAWHRDYKVGYMHQKFNWQSCGICFLRPLFKSVFGINKIYKILYNLFVNTNDICLFYINFVYNLFAILIF